MFRLAVVTVVALSIGFAPVPKVKVSTNPDQDIKRLVGLSSDTFPFRKKRALEGMKALKEVLLKKKQMKEVEIVNQRILLLESMNTDRPLNPDLMDFDVLFSTASLSGKYTDLQHVIYAKFDSTHYGQFHDFGAYPPITYLGTEVKERCHWVFLHDRWFLWKTNHQEKPIDSN